MNYSAVRGGGEGGGRRKGGKGENKECKNATSSFLLMDTNSNDGRNNHIEPWRKHYSERP